MRELARSRGYKHAEEQSRRQGCDGCMNATNLKAPTWLWIPGHDVRRSLCAPHHRHLQVTDDNVKVATCLRIHRLSPVLCLCDAHHPKASQLTL